MKIFSWTPITMFKNSWILVADVIVRCQIAIRRLLKWSQMTRSIVIIFETVTILVKRTCNPTVSLKYYNGNEVSTGASYQKSIFYHWSNVGQCFINKSIFLEWMSNNLSVESRILRLHKGDQYQIFYQNFKNNFWHVFVQSYTLLYYATYCFYWFQVNAPSFLRIILNFLELDH